MDRKYIKLENVSKTIKGNLVLNSISLTMEENKVYGVVGINGSGKTMLLRAIAGLIKTEGKVIVAGDVMGENKFPESVGVLIENPAFLNEFTALQNLKLISFISDGITENEVEDIINKVGLDPSSKKKYGKFSLGMKERLGIGQAIMGWPRLVLLDEPTNALDKGGIGMLKGIIGELKDRGSTVVIASHDEEFLAGCCDEIIKMEKGMIV